MPAMYFDLLQMIRGLLDSKHNIGVNLIERWLYWISESQWSFLVTVYQPSNQSNKAHMLWRFKMCLQPETRQNMAGCCTGVMRNKWQKWKNTRKEEKQSRNNSSNYHKKNDQQWATKCTQIHHHCFCGAPPDLQPITYRPHSEHISAGLCGDVGGQSMNSGFQLPAGSNNSSRQAFSIRNKFASLHFSSSQCSLLWCCLRLWATS